VQRKVGRQTEKRKNPDPAVIEMRKELARKIAAIALRIWKKGETFDPKKLNGTT